jgi:cellulose synthase/poly-beta-1,6-N-acetylglucosamine synthase-like glycosyltransferase
MVYYEGHVTKDGDLVVNVSGDYVSLKDFLRMARVGRRDDRPRGSGERRRVRTNTLAALK